MSVLAVIITADRPLSPCIAAIEAEGVPYIVNQQDPIEFCENETQQGKLINKYKNCSSNRNAARERALKTDASHFLFLDDDMVIPAGGVRSLLSHRKQVMSGWYPILGSIPTRYVAGRWVADNTFMPYHRIENSVVRTDVIAAGCCMIDRATLEKIPFEHGTDKWCLNGATGEPMFLGECGEYGNRCNDLGIQPFIDGNVVCTHLVRPRNFTSKETLSQ